MSTTKPRITITLEPKHHQVLQRLAGHQGQSMSSIVAELVESVVPVLERVCEAIETAKQAQAGVRENLVRVAEESEKALMPHLQATMAQLDMFMAQVEQAGQKAAEEDAATVTRRDARKRARRGAGAKDDEGSDPRPVITGVRVTDGSHSRRRKGHAV